MTKITTEYYSRIYDDTTGTYIQVGPDADGLDLCRIIYNETDVPQKEIILPWDQAEAVAKTIFLLARKNQSTLGKTSS